MNKGVLIGVGAGAMVTTAVLVAIVAIVLNNKKLNLGDTSPVINKVDKVVQQTAEKVSQTVGHVNEAVGNVDKAMDQASDYLSSQKLSL